MRIGEYMIFTCYDHYEDGGQRHLLPSPYYSYDADKGYFSIGFAFLGGYAEVCAKKEGLQP